MNPISEVRRDGETPTAITPWPRTVTHVTPTVDAVKVALPEQTALTAGLEEGLLLEHSAVFSRPFQIFGW